MSENLENSKQIEEENDPDNVRDSICSKSIQSQLERKIDSISNDHDINDSEDEKESDNENQLNEIDQEQNNSPDQTELFNSLNRRDSKLGILSSFI